MERKLFSVLFFIKRTKLRKNGEATIAVRITPRQLKNGSVLSVRSRLMTHIAKMLKSYLNTKQE